ncbi:MAG TPA: TolC family protein [Bryobacteraceae bacterium]|jgi:outer membrane protein TolC
MKSRGELGIVKDLTRHVALLLAFPLMSMGQTAPGDLVVDFRNAIDRARQYANVLQSAGLAARIATEDRVQAKSTLLPSVNLFNQFIYTQANGSDTGVFVASNGPRVYTSQVNVHEDLSLARHYEYQRTIAAEAAAKARIEIASRGLVAAVVQSYYGVIAAEHKLKNAQGGVTDAEHFLDITQKQEHGGEVAHADVVKAQLQLDQRKRDAQDAQLAIEKAKIGLAVLIFPDFTQTFRVTDDLEPPTGPAVPAQAEVEASAKAKSPELNVAKLNLKQEEADVNAARTAYFPAFSFDYFYGLNANQLAYRNQFGQLNLGNSAVVTMTVPVWSWGGLQSKVRQARLRQQQAQLDLNLTERQLAANVYGYYLEAQVAARQIESLRRSVDLAAESVKLTLLRYQAGESTALEVVDAETTLLQARNGLDDGLARFRIALGALQTLTGTL